MNILVLPDGPNWVAFHKVFTTPPVVGKTKEEAIGSFIIQHASLFQIRVDDDPEEGSSFRIVRHDRKTPAFVFLGEGGEWTSFEAADRFSKLDAYKRREVVRVRRITVERDPSPQV